MLHTLNGNSAHGTAYMHHFCCAAKVHPGPSGSSLELSYLVRENVWCERDLSYGGVTWADTNK